MNVYQALEHPWLTQAGICSTERIPPSIITSSATDYFLDSTIIQNHSQPSDVWPTIPLSKNSDPKNTKFSIRSSTNEKQLQDSSSSLKVSSSSRELKPGLSA